MSQKEKKAGDEPETKLQQIADSLFWLDDR